MPVILMAMVGVEVYDHGVHRKPSTCWSRVIVSEFNLSVQYMPDHRWKLLCF